MELTKKIGLLLSMFFSNEGERVDRSANTKNCTMSYSTIDRYDHMTHRKPNISYAELIAEALERSEGQMLTLKEIYAYISSNYPYFNMNKTGWQNSIRHNLSLNKAFYKVPRGVGNPGKGSYWKINYEFYAQKQGYKTKRISSRLCNRANVDDYIAQQGFLEDIGVTEMCPKNNLTSVFHGNLSSLCENFDSTDQPDTKPANHIFSFRK